MILHPGRSILLASVLILATAEIYSAESIATPAASLTAMQIVDEMQRQNQARVDALRELKSVRVYRVEYRGFSTVIAARLEVEYHYSVATGKSFRFLSQSGSKMLCEKVLKRAVESEKEASQDKNSTALTPANYRFQLAGIEALNGRRAYILAVEPVVPSKFLYKGKVWVDAEDFAVIKIDAEPAKNPSFWISHTRIQQSFTKVGDFWQPEHNRSESKARVGGTAVLTIDYGVPQIVPALSSH